MKENKEKAYQQGLTEKMPEEKALSLELTLDSGEVYKDNEKHFKSYNPASVVFKRYDWYFKPRFFENWGNGRIYRAVGVPQFKKYIVGRSIRWMNRHSGDKASSYSIGPPTRANALEHESEARLNEAIHMSAGAFMAGITLLNVADGELSIPIIATQTALSLLNIYLGFMQRYNRVRIYNAVNRHKKHQDKNEIQTRL